MQIQNIVETSFIDSGIPDLIWISALFNSAHDKAAVDGVIEFLIACHKVIASEQYPPLSFLSSFDRLTATQKSSIVSDPECKKRIPFLKKELWHQYALLDRYPLAFIFTEEMPPIDRVIALDRFKRDVQELLDRSSHHATKVQTTAVVGVMASGKMSISRSIDLPDPNSVFTNPESPEARRVASFMRASLNARPNMDEGHLSTGWANDFWGQAYKLDGCS